MLNGLEANEILCSEILQGTETFRIDSEYYNKEAVRVAYLVKLRKNDFKSFNELGLSVNASAFYPSIEPYYGQGDLPFLRVADVNRYIDYENCTTIPKELTSLYPTIRTVCKGDIILTKGGSVARVGLVGRESSACRDLIFINSSLLPKNEYYFYYLYFQTDFCNKLLLRSSSQSVQAHLTILLVREVPVYQPKEKFRNLISQIVELALDHKTKSESQYQNILNEISQTLGFSDIPIPDLKSSVRKYSKTFGQTGRLDSEHYDIGYENVENKIIESGSFSTIEGLSSLIQRGKQPEYADKGLPVVNSKHVREKNVEINENRLGVDLGKSMLKIIPNDVLINGTGVGTIGRSSVYLHQTPAIPDNHVTIIRECSIDPIYLSTFLNSKFGQCQVQKHQRGSSGQVELYPADIGKILIWIAPQKIQDQISNLYRSSFENGKMSEKLLDIGTKAINNAIEVNEAFATDWIENQLSELGVVLNAEK